MEDTRRKRADGTCRYTGLVSSLFGLIQQPRYLLGAQTVYLDHLAAAGRACNQSYIAPANTQPFGEEAEQLFVGRLIDGRRPDAYFEVRPMTSGDFRPAGTGLYIHGKSLARGHAITLLHQG